MACAGNSAVTASKRFFIVGTCTPAPADIARACTILENPAIWVIVPATSRSTRGLLSFWPSNCETSGTRRKGPCPHNDPTRVILHGAAVLNIQPFFISANTGAAIWNLGASWFGTVVGQPRMRHVPDFVVEQDAVAGFEQFAQLRICMAPKF